MAWGVVSEAIPSLRHLEEAPGSWVHHGPALAMVAICGSVPDVSPSPSLSLYLSLYLYHLYHLYLYLCF